MAKQTGLLEPVFGLFRSCLSILQIDGQDTCIRGTDEKPKFY